LARAGIVERAGRGRFKLEASVTRYCEHIRKTASQRGGDARSAHQDRPALVTSRWRNRLPGKLVKLFDIGHVKMTGAAALLDDPAVRKAYLGGW